MEDTRNQLAVEVFQEEHERFSVSEAEAYKGGTIEVSRFLSNFHYAEITLCRVGSEHFFTVSFCEHDVEAWNVTEQSPGSFSKPPIAIYRFPTIEEATKCFGSFIAATLEDQEIAGNLTI